MLRVGMGARSASEPETPSKPLRHAYVCLVHEQPECVLDLVRNLRALDPGSSVLLYNGGRDQALLADPRLAQLGALMHPRPRAMVWGRLHGFALDCMEFALAELPFDVLTIVDSDQLLLRAGYAQFLSERVELAGLGMLSSSAGRHGPQSRHVTVRSAWRDLRRWRPWLARFPTRNECFVHWTFWPGTLFTRAAAESVVARFREDRGLRVTLEQSRMSVTEEIVLPTLVRLLGLRVDQNPACLSWVRHRPSFSCHECEQALLRDDAFFMHPVPRAFDDPVRQQVRAHHGGY
jgi:hypothetical protein